MPTKKNADQPRSAAKRRAQRAPLPAKSKRPSAKTLRREEKPVVYLTVPQGEEAMGDLQLLVLAKRMGWLPAIKEAVRQGRTKGHTLASAAAKLGVSMQLIQAWERTAAVLRNRL